MTEKIKKSLLLIAIPILMASAIHKFYVSVTNVEYVEEEKSLQITSRIFIDDLEELLAVRYDIEAALATANEVNNSDDLISKYLNSKFEIKINGQSKAYSFLGKEYRDDLIVCYLEIPGIDIPNVSSIEVRNDVLTELFEEQQNVVHLKIGTKKKSFILMRENNKGMLNF